MKTLIKIKLLILVLLFSSIAMAGDDRDGYWWRKQSEQNKTAYACGVADGFYLWGDLHTIEKQWGMVEMMRKTALGRMIEGLDTFYQDPKNRSIATGAAVVPVVLLLNGAHKDKVQIMVEALRHENPLEVIYGMR